jgi:hypothetical protein
MANYHALPADRSVGKSWIGRTVRSVTYLIVSELDFLARRAMIKPWQTDRLESRIKRARNKGSLDSQGKLTLQYTQLP